MRWVHGKEPEIGLEEQVLAQPALPDHFGSGSDSPTAARRVSQLSADR